MKFWFSGLRTRILGLVALSALPAFGALIWVHIHARNAQLAQHLQSVRHVAAVEAAAESATIHDLDDLLSTLAHVPAIRAGGKPCTRILREALKRSPFLANLGFIDKDGQVGCSALPYSADLDLGYRRYFRRALNGGGFASGTYEIGRITGVATINFGYPVAVKGGGSVGVVYAALRVNSLLGRVAGNMSAQGMQTALINGDGRVLARLPHHIGRGRACSFPVSGRTGSARPACDYADGNLLPGAGRTALRVAVAVPTGPIYAAASHDLWQETVTLCGLFFLLLAGAWLGAERLLTRPIELLARMSRRIAGGDLGARVDMRRGARETRDLARAFNTMAESLQARDRNARQQLDEIQRLSRVYRVMSGINRVLLRVRDVRQFRSAVCRVAVEEGGFPLAWIARIEPETSRIVPLAWAGRGGEDLGQLGLSADPGGRGGLGPSGQAARTGKAQYLNDLDAVPELEPWREWIAARGFRSQGVLPLRFGRTGGKGLLILYSPDVDFFDYAEQRLLEDLAGDASLGFDLIDTERELSWRTHHDLITGLGNRALLIDTLPQTMAHAQRRGGCCALLLVVIERFDELRGLHAQSRADEILRVVGQSLQELVYPGDLVVRLEGGTFGVLLDDLPNAAAAGVAAARILRAAGQRGVMLDGGEHIPCSLRGGAAVHPGDADGPEEFVRSALVAARAGARTGADYVFYSSELNEKIQARARVERALGRAIQERQLRLVYQPIVELQTRAISGVEALARWHSPELGHVSPGVFIPVAEESGLIAPLGDWVLDAAVEQVRSWLCNGWAAPHLGLNVSAKQLRDSRFIKRLMCGAEELAAEGIELAIEITETAVLENLDQAGSVLRDMRRLGAAVWMDDFGTGYSSLAYLSRLDIDVLKIDIDFVRRMSEDARAATLVETIVGMAEGLGIRCLAEGIETEEQYLRLLELGCALGQGYWFARPHAPAELARYVGRRLPLETGNP